MLAVSNANPWKDFTNGSILFVDLAGLDYGTGRNLVSDVAITAIETPSFSGAMTLAEDRDLLLVTNRLSEDARTREASDGVWFVDVSEPTAPALATVGADGATVDVGYDPSAIAYDAATGLAFVVNRTSHDVSILDVGASPVELVPPGGNGSLDAWTFTDADASGSRAAFVTLDEPEDAGVVAHDWTMRWSVGTLRAWVPVTGGVHRLTGNGEDLWQESGVPLDLDVSDSEDVTGIADPAFVLDGEIARLFFVDGGTIWTASALSLQSWQFGDAAISPREDAWDAVIGAPSVVLAEDGYHLFYAGGDGTTSSIGLAISGDGATFTRQAEPVFAVEGASIGDPTVVRDAQADLWRMWFTYGDGTLGQAVSEDLTTWTLVEEATFAPATGAYDPVVGHWGGLFHMLYATVSEDGAWSVAEATSLDGVDWTDAGTPFALREDALDEPSIALQVATEDAFRIEDDSGEVFPLALEPGETISNTDGGWRARVAVGFAVDPEDAGAASVELGSIAGDLAFVTLISDDGVSRIGAGDVAAGEMTLGADAVLDPDDLGVEGLSAPVVIEDAAGWLMLFARTEAGVTSIGRATSADGVTWEADADAILAPEGSWESVAVEPGSVQVLEDGTLRLWYGGYDGERWRVGMAESADGGATFARVAGLANGWQFDAGAPGEWTDSGVRHPWVIRDGDVDRMWFSGFDGDAWEIGYAERTGDTADFTSAIDEEETPRPVIARGSAFGADDLAHPVVIDTGTEWELWYTGFDDGIGRLGRAVAHEPDRVRRDLRLPTLADTWGFTAIPADDAEAISLDATVEGSTLVGLGCSGIARDDTRGFLYVGCKLSPWIYVVDVRDDGTDGAPDLNYLDLEAAIWVETSTNGCSDLTSGQCSGLRSVAYDEARGWLWGLGDEPEAVYAVDVAGVTDDGSLDLLREDVSAMLPLPRSGERDEGVETQAYVGPSQLALHPDGRHLFVTNFNNNSVSVFDLGLGAGGTLVAEARDLGENPYAIRLFADGSRAVVGFYSGEVDGGATSSTLAVLDADPTSPTFLQAQTWVVNQ